MRPRTLHRQTRRSIVAVAAVSTLLFAVPLAAVVWRVERDVRYAELAGLSTRAAALVPDNLIGSGPVAVPVSVDPTTTVYDPAGNRSAGPGPTQSVVAARAADGRSHRGRLGGAYVVTVPVTSDGTVVAVVQTSRPITAVLTSAAQVWALMAVVAAAVMVAASLLARRESSRLLTPLTDLTVAARALGAGDVTTRPVPSGLAEVDELGDALAVTAAALEDALVRERTFSTDVAHQLRTPLAGLTVSLESAPPDVATALERARLLQQTVDDLLRLRRDLDASGRTADVAGTANRAAQRWSAAVRAAFRTLRVDVDPTTSAAAASETCVAHVLDVLLDNALRHGSGVVRLTAGSDGDLVRVEVADGGLADRPDTDAWFTRRRREPGHGIGLALARSLAEADGGRLYLAGGAFVLLLPARTGVTVSA